MMNENENRNDFLSRFHHFEPIKDMIKLLLLNS